MTNKRKRGRPSLYKDEYVKQAFRLRLLGATDAQLSEFFEVNVDTINEWKLNSNGKPDTTNRRYGNGFVRNYELQWY